MSSSRLADNFLQRLKSDGLVRPRERVLVALSGGSDSVALLHLLRSAAVPLQLTLFAAHLDHGIRPESGDDVDFVRSLCLQLNIPLISEQIDVPALAVAEKVGLEEAGRMARLAFLHKSAKEFTCNAIALGHHRGDQAETLLHHLGRGCGLHGLTGMRHQRGSIIRPLLPYSKTELLAYLAEIGADFVVDSSNDELNFTRNRIRHQLLPVFASLNPRIEFTLSALAEVAAREDDFWQGEMDRLAALLVQTEGDTPCLRVSELLRLHPAQRFRFLHRLLVPFAQLVRKEAGLRHVADLDRLLMAPAPQGEIHLPGVRALRRYDRLTLTSSRDQAPSFWSLDIPGPGLYRLPGGGALQVESALAAPVESPCVAEFAVSRLSFPVIVRPVQPGDRMRLVGMTGRKRLKELMQEQKLSLEERCRLCVLEKEEILWAIGVRRSALSLPRRGEAVWRVVHMPHNSCEIP